MRRSSHLCTLTLLALSVLASCPTSQSQSLPWKPSSRYSGYYSYYYHRRRTRQTRDSYSCQKAAKELLRDAFYAQVDLIRRGLPTRVIQAEYAYAVNKLQRYYPYSNYNSGYSRSHSVGSRFPCVRSSSVSYLFDSRRRARYALKYVFNIARWKPNINFLSLSKYPHIPEMSPDERALVDDMWNATWKRITAASTWRFEVKDFSFPTNVQVLHDPGRNEACREYKRFGPLTHERTIDAESLLLSLLVVSIKLHRMGGSYTSIVQMLKHFVAYAFNGVRCLRQEGSDLRIPLILQSAYARNVAFIYSSIINPPTEQPHIAKGAVWKVFRDEVLSLTSYNSWGNLEYAKLSGSSSIPKVVNSASSIMSSAQYARIKYYSQQDPATSRRQLKHSERVAGCRDGYVSLPRPTHITNEEEKCCALPCKTWAELQPASVIYPAELCCIRCNYYNGCPAGIQSLDSFDNEWTLVIVPEYGSQSEKSVALVRI